MQYSQNINTTAILSFLYSAFLNTVGFLIGFILGGITGYFGNWLWYRFGPSRKKPHFTMTTMEGTTSFSGLMTEDNREPILKALKSVKTRKPKISIVTVEDTNSSLDSSNYSPPTFESEE